VKNQGPILISNSSRFSSDRISMTKDPEHFPHAFSGPFICSPSRVFQREYSTVCLCTQVIERIFRVFSHHSWSQTCFKPAPPAGQQSHISRSSYPGGRERSFHTRTYNL